MVSCSDRTFPPRHAQRGIGAVTILALLIVSGPCPARTLSSADEVQLAHFGDPNNAQVEAITWSPDLQFFVVHSERGVIATNRSESTIRVYRSDDVRRFVAARAGEPPAPLWEFTRSTYKDGPIITKIKWLRDSSGIAFLQRLSSGNEQLVFGDLKRKSILPLTPEDQGVLQFDIKDQYDYVYIAVSPAIGRAIHAEQDRIGLVGTGRSLMSLMFPADKRYGQLSEWADLGELWAVLQGRRVLIRDKASGRPLPIHYFGEHPFGAGSLALSPDGKKAVAILAVSDVPSDWKRLYPPPDARAAIQIRTAGPQDIWALDGLFDVSAYYLVDLDTQDIRALTNAPTGYSTSNWSGAEEAAWSSDGARLLLSNTFLRQPQHGISTPGSPCVTVVEVASEEMTCVEHIEGGTYKKRSEKYVETATFVPNRNDAIRITYHRGGSQGSSYYGRAVDGRWSERADAQQIQRERPTLNVSIEQDLNRPPVIFARDPATNSGKILWDPNPQLKDIALTDVSTLTWEDESGRRWVGGLYKPLDYIVGRRYPLIVQTHGFEQHEFQPSGLWPTAFAAQQLSAAGFVVLQVPDCPRFETPQEAPCNVRGYESGARKLVAMGVVDPDRLGIIGFSRTCFSVMSALTKGHLRFGAASITEGFIMGYMDYMQSVDYGGNFDAHTVGAALGVGKPFGAEIYKWIDRSPEFNMEKVVTPLQIVATNSHNSLLEMWEPYAALRFLNRPVDLLILQEGTHPLSNPRQIMTSQTSTVDWMRFWLQGQEDSSTEKVVQYRRWEKLCDLQVQGNPDRPAFCVHSKPTEMR